MDSKRKMLGWLFDELKVDMQNLGFKGKKTDFSFKKATNDWEFEIIGDIRIYNKPYADFHILCAHTKVEDILEKALSVRYLHGIRRATFSFPFTKFVTQKQVEDDFAIEADDYFDIVAASFIELLNNKIFPALAAVESLELLDKAINKIPFEQFPLFDFAYNQALRGLVVRHLVGQHNLHELKEMYLVQMKKQTYYHKSNSQDLEAVYNFLSSRGIQVNS